MVEKKLRRKFTEEIGRAKTCFFRLNKRSAVHPTHHYEKHDERQSHLQSFVDKRQTGDDRNEHQQGVTPFIRPPLNLPSSMSVRCRIILVQKYLNSLQYNNTDTQFFTIKKTRPLCGLMETAKEIVKESLPIKCLEAVVVSLYCTSNYPGLDRFPISFKSHHEGATHRHIVLGLHLSGLYGALGLSRKANLMYKPLKYMSLSDLIIDFLDSYEENGHEVVRVKMGSAVPHDLYTYETVQWGVSIVQCNKTDKKKLVKEIDKEIREIRKKSSSWHLNQTKQNFESPTAKKNGRIVGKVIIPKYCAVSQFQDRSSPASQQSLESKEVPNECLDRQRTLCHATSLPALK